MSYLKIFLSFLQIGAFSFGGGYAALPMIYEQVVVKNQWLSIDEFSDLITISQMTPGPIAINAATFVGNRLLGPLGSMAATFGCILPSCIFVTILAYLYMKYRKMKMLQGILQSLRPAVVAMIATAGVIIIRSSLFVVEEKGIQIDNIQIRSIFYLCSSLFLIRKVKLNPILVMLLCGIMEVVIAMIKPYVV